MAKFVLCLLILAACAQDVLSVTDYYMSSHCGYTLNVTFNEQVRLQLSPHQYRNNWDCQLHLRTTIGNTFHVHFTSMDILYGLDCPYEKLKILGVTSTDYQMCGHANPYEFKSSGPDVTFYFHSDRSISRSGFDAIITPFHTGSCDLEDEFECDNGRCIDDSIKCSDYNPCGDNSEPVDCISSSLTGGEIFFIVVGVIAVIFIVIAVVVRCSKKQGAVGHVQRTPDVINVSTVQPEDTSMANMSQVPPPSYATQFR